MESVKENLTMYIAKYLYMPPFGLEQSLLLLLLFILLSIFFRWLFRYKVYLHDAKKYTISMRLTYVLLFLIYLGVIFSNGTPEWSSFLKIIIILSLAKLFYHIFSATITRYYGVEKDKDYEVTTCVPTWK